MSEHRKYNVIRASECERPISVYIPCVNNVLYGAPCPQNHFGVISNSELGAFVLLQEHFSEQFENVLTPKEFWEEVKGLDLEDYDIDSEWSFTRMDLCNIPGFDYFLTSSHLGLK